MVVLNRVYNSMQQWNSNSLHHYLLEKLLLLFAFLSISQSAGDRVGAAMTTPPGSLKGAGAKAAE